MSERNLKYKTKVENDFNDGNKLEHYNVDWLRIYRCVECFGWQTLLEKCQSADEAIVALEAGANLFKPCKCHTCRMSCDDCEKIYGNTTLQRIIKKGYVDVITYIIDCLDGEYEESGIENNNVYKILNILTSNKCHHGDHDERFLAYENEYRTIVNYDILIEILGHSHIRDIYISSTDNIDLRLILERAIIDNNFQAVKTIVNTIKYVRTKKVMELCDMCRGTYYRASELLSLNKHSLCEEYIYKDRESCVKPDTCYLKSCFAYDGWYDKVWNINIVCEGCTDENVVKLLINERIIDPSARNNHLLSSYLTMYNNTKSTTIVNIMILILYHPNVWNTLSDDRKSVYLRIPGMQGG